MWPFTKKQLPIPVSLEVHIIDDKSNDVAGRFGIREERRTELVKIAQKLADAGTDYSTIMSEVSKHCKHPNELAFICFSIGNQSGRASMGPVSLLAQLLG